MVLLLVILAMVIAWLWHQLRTLRERVDALEYAGGFVPTIAAAIPTEPDIEPESVQPAAFVAPDAEPTPISILAMPTRANPIAATARRQPVEQADQPVADESVLLSPERSSRFEDLFGRRLPIWAGGVTLAVAGFLIVKYSIEAGLLSPFVRVVMGLLFGTALIAGAEAASRRAEAVGDPRVRQALAGAGVATLYATTLAAANLYHLVEPATAFIGMALVTALAGALSIRFGAASAMLGLIGGLAAPALVGSTQANVPLLTLYLTLAVGGLCALGQRQRWWWLGAAALAGGFGWGSLLILNGALSLNDALAVGLYTTALAAGLPLLLTGDRGGMVRLASSVMGCAQLAALVATGGFAPLHWGLFALISIAFVWLSRREAMLAEIPALGLGVALLLGLVWPHPTASALATMLAAATMIYGGAAVQRVWSNDAVATDAAQIALLALGIGLLPLAHFPNAHAPLAGPALLAALLAGSVAAFGWSVPKRRDDARFAILAITAAALVGLAAALTLAGWMVPPALALLALALTLLGECAGDGRVERSAWAFGTVCMGLLLAAPAEIARLDGGVDTDALALIRWLVPALVAVVMAVRGTPRIATGVQPIAALLGYAAAAQIVPAIALPLVPVGMLVGLGLVGRAAVVPGVATAGLLALGWAGSPLLIWLGGAGGAFIGEPLFVTALPPLSEAVVRLAAPALALSVVASRVPLPHVLRNVPVTLGAMLATIAAHILYKHGFAINGEAAFIAHGLAERTIWEMLLGGLAVAAWRLAGMRLLPVALGGGSLAHFAWFTVLLHDPLWVLQEAGVWLVPAYATAFALVLVAGRTLPQAARTAGWAMMGLIVLFALSALRQLAHGTMPLWLGTGPGEDIARSVLAIALAVGFLRFGIARGARDWRIASLLLMLVAVLKVFLFDAAGLDGLFRIASFAALGFSLIGVGWLYSRYLPDAAQ